MSITIDPNAQEAQNMSNDFFLLKSLGLLDYDDPMNNPNITVTYEVTTRESRVEGDNIRYGNPIEINADNLDQLGLGDDIITYHMDQNGNLELSDHSDFSENNAEGFMLNMDDDVSGWRYDPQSEEYTITRMNGNEAPAFMIQPVEVDGMLQGYFVYGKDDDNFDSGLYLDASAVNLDGMNADMKAALFADPTSKEIVTPDQSIVVDNGFDQTADHTVAMKL